MGKDYNCYKCGDCGKIFDIGHSSYQKNTITNAIVRVWCPECHSDNVYQHYDENYELYLRAKYEDDMYEEERDKYAV